MSFQKPGCYPHIKLLTFCLLFREFQILSINCQLLGAFSHSEPVEGKKKQHTTTHHHHKKKTKQKNHTTIFKVLLNIQPCIHQRSPEADLQCTQPLEVNSD